MRQLKFLAALFCAGALLSLPAAADEASVKKTVEDKINGKVQSVTKSGYLGLYEVFADGQVLYTDEKVSVLLIGTLVDDNQLEWDTPVASLSPELAAEVAADSSRVWLDRSTRPSGSNLSEVWVILL